MSANKPSKRLDEHLSRCEKKFLRSALQKHRGNISRAAQWLGISRRAMSSKLYRYGLESMAARWRKRFKIGGPRQRRTSCGQA